MPDLNLSKIGEWLTASERRLAAASLRPTLTKTSAVVLKKNIARARELRDKWRDVLARQRREGRRHGPGGTANERSRQKSDIFAIVLARFEQQLAKLSDSPTARSLRPPARQPSKSTRSRQHRQTRSQTRQELAGVVGARRAERARSRPAASPAPAKPKLKKLKKVSSPSRSANRSAKQPRERQPADLKTSQTRSALSRHRVHMSGQATRIHGHVQARGRRDQARRDRRR